MVAALWVGSAGCWFDTELVESDSFSVDALGFDRLVLNVQDGDLEVSGEAGRSTVDVLVDVFSRSSRSRALGDANTRLVEQEGRLLLIATVDDESGGGTFVDLRVRVPERFLVEGNDSTGDVFIRGVGGVGLVDTSGDMEVREIAGSVLINDGSGDLRIERVAGQVEVDDGSGDMFLRDLEMGVVIEDGSGNISLTNIAGRAAIQDGSGDIRAENVQTLDILSDTSGDVRRF